MWKRSEFDKCKADITAFLHEKFDQDHLDDLLSYCLYQISTLKDKSDKAMETFIYIMKALNFHLQKGGLKASEVRDLLDLGSAILTLGGVKPRTSALTYLHGELHLVSSQMHFFDGQPLLAAWEQQIAIHLSGPNPPGGVAYQAHHAGIHALRLGFGELALSELRRAYEENEDEEFRIKTVLHLLQALRLTGNLEAAEDLDKETAKLPFPERAVLERDWERICREVKTTQNLAPLVASVRNKKPHHRPGYLLEAFFWTRSLSSQDWFQALPKLKTLRQKKSLDFSFYSTFYRCAAEMEKTYDTEIPFVHRLGHAKKILSLCTELQNIDKQLLVLASLIRWLIRSNNRPLAKLLYAEYSSASHRLSGGRQTDALGILQDLGDKSWLQLP